MYSFGIVLNARRDKHWLLLQDVLATRREPRVVAPTDMGRIHGPENAFFDENFVFTERGARILTTAVQKAGGRQIGLAKWATANAAC